MSHAQAVPSRVAPVPTEPALGPPTADPSPPDDTLDAALSLARTLAIFVALIAGLLFLILLFVFVLGTLFGYGTGGVVGVAYCFLSAVVNYLLWREIPRFQRLAAEHHFSELRERLLLWMILGLLFFVVEGIVLIFAYLNADDRSRGSGSATFAAPPPGASGVGGPPVAPPPT